MNTLTVIPYNNDAYLAYAVDTQYGLLFSEASIRTFTPIKISELQPENSYLVEDKWFTDIVGLLEVISDRNIRKWIVQKVIPAIYAPVRVRTVLEHLAVQKGKPLIQVLMDEVESGLNLSKFLGVDQKKTTTSLIKQLTGIELQLEDSKVIVPPAEYQAFSPSEICDEVNMSRNQFNFLLEKMGLQKKVISSSGKPIWRVTKKGEQYAVQSSHKIKWYRTILKIISEKN